MEMWYSSSDVYAGRFLVPFLC